MDYYNTTDTYYTTTDTYNITTKILRKYYTSTDLQYLWCHSLSHHYFCAKIVGNLKKSLKLFPLGKTLLLMGRKDPQEELS